MAKVLFYTATSSQFKALSLKEENALYFITDTGEIYKGATRFSFPVKQVSEFPATGESGVIYISVTGEAKIWAGTSYIALGSNMVDNFVSAAERYVVTDSEAGRGIYTGMEPGDIGILFTMNNGNKLFVRLADLVDTYTADNTGSQGVTVNVDGYKISAEVKVSTAAGNQLLLKNDGIYAAPLEWQTVSGGTQ